MKQQIVSFNKDEEGHWRAVLTCGHMQHVRHDPPMTKREWVLSQQGRDALVGHTIECLKCDQGRPPDIVM